MRYCAYFPSSRFSISSAGHTVWSVNQKLQGCNTSTIPQSAPHHITEKVYTLISISKHRNRNRYGILLPQDKLDWHQCYCREPIGGAADAITRVWTTVVLRWASGAPAITTLPGPGGRSCGPICEAQEQSQPYATDLLMLPPEPCDLQRPPQGVRLP